MAQALLMETMLILEFTSIQGYKMWTNELSTKERIYS